MESPVENLFELKWLDQYISALRKFAPASEGRAVRTLIGAIDRLGRSEQLASRSLICSESRPGRQGRRTQAGRALKSPDDCLSAAAELAPLED